MEVVIAIFSTALVFSGLIIFQRRSFSSKFEDYNNFKQALSGLKSNIEEAQDKLSGVAEKLNQSMSKKTLLDEDAQRLALNNERLIKEIEAQEAKKKWFESDIKAISENYTEVDKNIRKPEQRCLVKRPTTIA